MSDVKRYDQYYDGEPMQLMSDGDYVRYEDYAELRKQLEQANAMLNWWVRWTEDLHETINDPMTEKWRSVLLEKLAETKLLIGQREPE